MIGKTLSHYEITGLLGKGGMGEVYRACDTKLKRDVALKILPADMAADPARLERFQREAETVAGLNHPHIVTLYSVEEDQGVHFLTMELVEGQSLEQTLTPDGLPLAKVLEIGTAVADALATAHEKSIVHRDLKPANVMVTTDGRVKVLDFGLAKLTADEPTLEVEATIALDLTQEGSVLGTVPYMSPEQVQGRTIDSRSDVFSLGVLLFEMLTGAPPFHGDTFADLISSILRDMPQSPSRLQPGIPGDLDAIVNRCLEKDPERRYRSARELREGLEFANRQQTNLKGATATPSIAVLPFLDMSPEKDQGYFCEGIADEMINAFSEIEGLRVASRTSSFGTVDLGLDIQGIGERLNVDTVLEGSVRKAGTQLRVTARLINAGDGFNLWSRKYNRELEDVFAIQDEIANSIVRALRIELSAGVQRALDRAATTDIEAYDLYLRGRKFFYQGTRKGIEQAREMFSSAARRDPGYALAFVGLANCYSYLFMYFDRTAANRNEAVDASQKAIRFGEAVADAHAARGLALSLNQQYEKATRELESALQINPRLFEAYYFYARICREQGKFEKAAHLFEEASRVRPEDYQTLIFLSSALRNLGRTPEYHNALHRAKTAVVFHLETNPNDARAYYLGAQALVELGEKEKGLEWGQRALTINPDDTRILYNLTCLYCAADRLEDAVGYFEQAIEAGYASREWIDKDSDLDPIRDDPRFQAALSKLGSLP